MTLMVKKSSLVIFLNTFFCHVACAFYKGNQIRKSDCFVSGQIVGRLEETINKCFERKFSNIDNVAIYGHKTERHNPAKRNIIDLP